MEERRNPLAEKPPADLGMELKGFRADFKRLEARGVPEQAPRGPGEGIARTMTLEAMVAEYLRLNAICKAEHERYRLARAAGLSYKEAEAGMLEGYDLDRAGDLCEEIAKRRSPQTLGEVLSWETWQLINEGLEVMMDRAAPCEDNLTPAWFSTEETLAMLFVPENHHFTGADIRRWFDTLYAQDYAEECAACELVAAGM